MSKIGEPLMFTVLSLAVMVSLGSILKTLAPTMPPRNVPPVTVTVLFEAVALPAMDTTLAP